MTAAPEPYADRLERIIHALQNNAMDKPEARQMKLLALAMLREQAQMIVRLENELETAYGS